MKIQLKIEKDCILYTNRLIKCKLVEASDTDMDDLASMITTTKLILEAEPY